MTARIKRDFMNVLCARARALIDVKRRQASSLHAALGGSQRVEYLGRKEIVTMDGINCHVVAPTKIYSIETSKSGAVHQIQNILLPYTREDLVRNVFLVRLIIGVHFHKKLLFHVNLLQQKCGQRDCKC